jgi:hypothetical protein
VIYNSKGYLSIKKIKSIGAKFDVTNVKRTESILLSKGEALFLYTSRPGTLRKSMEAHDCKCQWR